MPEMNPAPDRRAELKQVTGPSLGRQTYYMKLAPPRRPEHRELKPLRHSESLNERGDPLGAGDGPVPRRATLDSGTWRDVQALASALIDAVDSGERQLKPFRYLFMVTAPERGPAEARLAGITTTEVGDFRAGESPGCPIILRQDEFLQIAVGLTNTEGREVHQVDL